MTISETYKAITRSASRIKVSLRRCNQVEAGSAKRSSSLLPGLHNAIRGSLPRFVTQRKHQPAGIPTSQRAIETETDHFLELLRLTRKGRSGEVTREKLDEVASAHSGTGRLLRPFLDAGHDARNVAITASSSFTAWSTPSRKRRRSVSTAGSLYVAAKKSTSGWGVRFLVELARNLGK